MAKPGSHLIENLSNNEHKKLAQLIYLPLGLDLFDPGWLSSQATLIESLPPKLLKPKSLLLRFALHLDNSIQRASLCSTHKLLNPFLIRRILIQVTAECTVRLQRLVSSPSPLAIPIHELIIRLQSLNSLWMSPEMYRVTFGVMPQETRFELVESHCEACILARIGGNVQIICDLRTNMLGRLKKRGPRPRLLALVEAWIELHGSNEKDRLLRESDHLGREVRDVRREMQLLRTRGEVAAEKQKAKKKDRRHFSSWESGQSDDSETIRVAYENDERPLLERDEINEIDEHKHDIEGSIINYYNSRISSATSAAHIHNARDIHPTFRDPVIFEAPSGTFARLPETPLNPFADLHGKGCVAQTLRPNYSAPTAYTESNYSRTYGDSNTASPFDSNPFLPGPVRRDAEEQARAYQSLVETNEEEESIPRMSTRDGRRLRREEQRIESGSTRAQDRTSTSTHWTGFY